MKWSNSLISFFICLALILAFGSGCVNGRTNVVGVPYHEESLYNYYLAKRYTSQGRYELAREKLALALAISRNPQFRERCMFELHGVENMIYAKRLQVVE